MKNFLEGSVVGMGERKIYVSDRQVDGMNAAAFASFIGFAAAGVIGGKDLTLEGFDQCLVSRDPSVLLDMHRDLSFHIHGSLPKIKQYILKSEELESQVLITYSDDFLVIEYLKGKADEFMQNEIMRRIVEHKRSWGVFEIEVA